MTFGEELGWGSSVSESERILDAFLARGGNFIDTANVYTLGHSEKIIGDHIGRHPSRRTHAVIATKFYGNLYKDDPNGGGAGRKSLMAACEQSLRRLQTDYIDLYWMHCYDKHTPIEETMRALDDLVRQGKVRYIGFSDTPAWKVAQAQTIAAFRGLSPLVALQIEYSLIERSVEGELMPMAQELGLGVTPWSPLKSGILSGKYRRGQENKADRGAWVTMNLNDRAFDIIDVLVRVAGEIGQTPARVALSWVQRQAGVASTIIGARTVAQLEDNLAALDFTLSTEHLSALNAVSRPTLNFPAEFLARAGSFMHPGLTVNGDTAPPSMLVPKEGAKVW
jgi:aryl-alcohol dehydrogenase-like predicted oxidoreductase